MATVVETTDLKDLKLRFGGSLVEQLGSQLYPSATATVAELISNAWDADAHNVWITLPFGEAWRPDSEIIVVDDGIGMTHDEARDAYLIVGRKRRVALGTDLTPDGRKLHGRKGIGKLAAFGTAKILECVTLRDHSYTAFRLDYDKIRQLAPDVDYDVEPVDGLAPLVSPETREPLEHGTHIRLTELWLKRALSESQFRQSMARRFAISQGEMRVVINGEPLSRFDMPVEFRFPRDGKPSDDIPEVDGWAIETLPDSNEVRWWIGFTEKPIEEDYLRGISILARGKMAQRPFQFERAQGTEGQLGQEYLVGEVQADWIDEGLDIDHDLIQSNRDQLQLEDERLEEFVIWGRRRLAWALRERNTLRAEKTFQGFEFSVQIDDLLKDYTASERRSMMQIARTASRLPEMTANAVRELMADVINSRSDVVVRQLMERIQQEDEPFQERIWALVHEFSLIDARKNLSIIEARLETISRLKSAVASGAREVPDIHNIIKGDTWLLDPRWHLLDDEVDIAGLGIDFEPETDDETGLQLDYLFVLQPRPPAKIDDVVVVEIKRGTTSAGRERKADLAEVNRFHDYVLAVQEHYARSTDRPRVRGLMIAQGYTRQAEPKRKSLETLGDLKLEFRSWDRVIEDTERMHLGWLAVSRRRVERGDESKSEETAE